MAPTAQTAQASLRLSTSHIQKKLLLPTAREDLHTSLKDFLNNNAVVNRTIHLLKACCCSIGDDENNVSKKQRPRSGLKPEELLKKWLHQSESSVHKHVKKCSCEQTEKATKLDEWIEAIHIYADYLPNFGCQKKLVWVICENELSKPEDNLGLLGALKRLVEWHGVRVVILCRQALLETEELQSWVDVLYSQVFTTSDELTRPKYRQLWSGSVAIAGNQGSILELPGFCMTAYENPWLRNTVWILSADIDEQTKQKEEMFTDFVLTDAMELIAPVAISEIPTYFLTDIIFSLSIPSNSKYIKKSRLFLQNLLQDSDLGYIMRIHYGTSWKERTSKDVNSDKSLKKEINGRGGDGKKEEENAEWTQLISSNISNIFVAPNKADMELTGDTGYYQFLVYKGVHEEFVAQLMRNTNQINPFLTQDLHDADILRTKHFSENNTEGKKLESVLSALPHWTGTGFMQLETDLETCQAVVLQQWIDERNKENESTLVTTDNLLAMLRVIREKFFEVHAVSFSSERLNFKSATVIQPKQAYLYDPSSQLERTALLIREAQEESAKNGPCGLSPPKSRVLTLDARQFLKFFKKDGTASKELTTIKLQQKSPKRRLCKYDSGNLRLEKWPQCKLYRYHDIYYYSEGETEELEALCEKMKARLLSMETASTCTLKQTHSTITVQRDVRKLRQNLNEEKSTEMKRRIKTPRSKRKVNTVITEKRKRMMQLSKQLQDVKGSQRSSVRPSPRKQCGTPRKSTPHSNRSNPRKTPRKSPVKNLTPRKRLTPKKTTTPRKTLKSPFAKKKEYTLEAKKARAKRHAQLLESILIRVLERHGISTNDRSFKACYQKLHTITKCFLKDLTSVTSLRDEMESIAEDNVQNVLKRVLKT